VNEIDIEAWVDAAPADQRGFREAVHIILDSIGHSQNLQARMVMKGGLLLAIRYGSTPIHARRGFFDQRAVHGRKRRCLAGRVRGGAGGG
jgi:hypothetical protein